MKGIPGWARRPDIISYVIDCYAGTDVVEGNSVKRRVYVWEDGDEIKMGNTEAFAEHLEKKYELLRVSPSALHTMLRELGETVVLHKPHAPHIRRGTGYKTPDPDEWVIGKVIKEVEESAKPE
jgi:hypothetical protein